MRQSAGPLRRGKLGIFLAVTLVAGLLVVPRLIG